MVLIIAKWLFMIYVLKYMYMRDGLSNHDAQYHNDSTSYAAPLHKILYFTVGLTLPQKVSHILPQCFHTPVQVQTGSSHPSQSAGQPEDV